MGHESTKVTIASLGFSSFDPYGLNFNLPNVTTLIINTNNPSMQLDMQGSHIDKGSTRIGDEDIHDEDRPNPWLALWKLSETTWKRSLDLSFRWSILWT